MLSACVRVPERLCACLFGWRRERDLMLFVSLFLARSLSQLTAAFVYIGSSSMLLLLLFIVVNI